MLVEIMKFFLSPFYFLFEPHLSNTIGAFTSEKTQRKAVKSIFIVVVASVLTSVAVVAYLGFYMIYVPKIAHVKPIYLQYQKDSSPYALVDFTENGLYESILTADQAYDVEIDLDVPTSDRNVALGNFMVGIELMAKNETVQYSSRPCILTYQSGLLRVIYTLWRLIPLVLGFTKEDQKLVIVMIKNMIESAEKPITQALITISNSHLEVYSAQIRLDAHFKGLRYFMYYHQIPTAITFITMFLIWEILFSIFAWRSFVSWWQDKVLTGPQKTLITSGGANDTNNITYNNNQDYDSERDDGRRSDTIERDNGTATESESEYEVLRSDSVISPTNTALVSDSGETSYNTESYITDDDDPALLTLEDDDSSLVVTETDGDDPIDDDDQTEGSATPTTRSRRSTVSETSTNESEIEDRPSTSTSTARLQSSSTRPYTRRAGSSGGNNDSNME